MKCPMHGVELNYLGSTWNPVTPFAAHKVKLMQCDVCEMVFFEEIVPLETRSLTPLELSQLGIVSSDDSKKGRL